MVCLFVCLNRFALISFIFICFSSHFTLRFNIKHIEKPKTNLKHDAISCREKERAHPPEDIRQKKLWTIMKRSFLPQQTPQKICINFKMPNTKQNRWNYSRTWRRKKWCSMKSLPFDCVDLLARFPSAFLISNFICFMFTIVNVEKKTREKHSPQYIPCSEYIRKCKH